MRTDRQHAQRALQVQVFANRRVEVLPFEAVHLDGHDVSQWRAKIAASAEAVSTTQQCKTFASFDGLGQRFQIHVLQRLGIQVADDERVVLGIAQFSRQDDGPAASPSRVDPLEIQFDVGRCVQRTSEELLLPSQSTFQIKHLQPAFQHAQKSTQLVVLRHQLARLFGSA